jgi:hypothetical protein
MKKGQRRARRLALYLSSIGIPPVLSAGSYKQWASGLQAQYNSLEAGRRKLARQTGRLLFRESAPLRSQSRLSQTQLAYSPRWPTLHLSLPEPYPDPERSSSTIFAGAGLRSHRLAPPAGCGTASRCWPDSSHRSTKYSK